MCVGLCTSCGASLSFCEQGLTSWPWRRGSCPWDPLETTCEEMHQPSSAGEGRVRSSAVRQRAGVVVSLALFAFFAPPHPPYHTCVFVARLSSPLRPRVPLPQEARLPGPVQPRPCSSGCLVRTPRMRCWSPFWRRTLTWGAAPMPAKTLGACACARVSACACACAYAYAYACAYACACACACGWCSVCLRMKCWGVVSWCMCTCVSVCLPSLVWRCACLALLLRSVGAHRMVRPPPPCSTNDPPTPMCPCQVVPSTYPSPALPHGHRCPAVCGGQARGHRGRGPRRVRVPCMRIHALSFALSCTP
jgi:hypothetical protein